MIVVIGVISMPLYRLWEGLINLHYFKHLLGTQDQTLKSGKLWTCKITERRSLHKIQGQLHGGRDHVLKVTEYAVAI